MEQGLGVLASATAKAPRNRDIAYHYAAALARAGDAGAARAQLHQILDDGAVFAERTKAAELLESLR